MMGDKPIGTRTADEPHGDSWGTQFALDEVREKNREVGQKAAARCSFQLHYSRAPYTRVFDRDEISGDAIDCAADPSESSPGAWSAGGEYPGNDWDSLDLTTEQEWVDHNASMAVNEAVHEALEWFQVDGRPWLDPHGEAERRIYKLTERFCAELAALRADVEVSR